MAAVSVQLTISITGSLFGAMPFRPTPVSIASTETAWQEADFATGDNTLTRPTDSVGGFALVLPAANTQRIVFQPQAADSGRDLALTGLALVLFFNSAQLPTNLTFNLPGSAISDVEYIWF